MGSLIVHSQWNCVSDIIVLVLTYSTRLRSHLVYFCVNKNDLEDSFSITGW